MIIKLSLSADFLEYTNCISSQLIATPIPDKCNFIRDQKNYSLKDHVKQIDCICKVKDCLFAKAFLFEEVCKKQNDSNLNYFLIDDPSAEKFVTKIYGNDYFQNLDEIDKTEYLRLKNSNAIYLLNKTNDGIKLFDSGISRKCLYETALFMESIALWTLTMKKIKYSINISSIIATILTILLVIFKESLSRNLHGKFLISFAITTVLNYSIFAFTTTEFYVTLDIMYKETILRSYMYLELAIYLWMNIICYHVFTTIERVFLKSVESCTKS